MKEKFICSLCGVLCSAHPIGARNNRHSWYARPYKPHTRERKKRIFGKFYAHLLRSHLSVWFVECFMVHGERYSGSLFTDYVFVAELWCRSSPKMFWCDSNTYLSGMSTKIWLKRSQQQQQIFDYDSRKTFGNNNNNRNERGQNENADSHTRIEDVRLHPHHCPFHATNTMDDIKVRWNCLCLIRSPIRDFAIDATVLSLALSLSLFPVPFRRCSAFVIASFSAFLRNAKPLLVLCSIRWLCGSYVHWWCYRTNFVHRTRYL